MTSMRPAAEATLNPITEAERAAWLGEERRWVVEHRHRFWWSPRPAVGFWRPVHLLARLSLMEATQPNMLCWGFQAPLRDEDAPSANATVPMHWIDDLAQFGEHKLSSNRRSQLRKSRRLVEFLQIDKPSLLQEQGYGVLVSSKRRTGYGRVPTREQYDSDIECRVRLGRHFVLGGFVEERLGGYITGFAIGPTAYVDEVVIATEALSTHVSIGLHFAFIDACRRTSGITEVVHGRHAVEDETLSEYKESIGFPVRQVPARLWVAPGMLSVVRRKAMATYYRWTGLVQLI